MLFKFNDKINKKVNLVITLLLFVLVGIFAFNLRWVALRGLDTDNDESTYTAWMGVYYSFLIENGEFGKIIDYRGEYEHPPLIKLIYGAAIYLTRVTENAEGVIFVCRIVSTIFSVFHTLLIFLISPIASIFFALDSWQIYYSAKAWLDSIATFFVSLAIYSLWSVRGKEWDRYVSISAVGLGLAFASKYITFIAGLVILYFLLTHFRNKPKYIFLYAGLVLITFVLANPNLWKNPIYNFWESVSFHKFYSDSFGPAKRYASFFGKSSIWQQISFLWTPLHPWKTRLIIFRWDRIIFILGFLGVVPLYRKSKLLFVWFITAFLFIILYPIKWPHYNLVFLPILCISAGVLVRQIYLNLFYFGHKIITKTRLNKEIVEEKLQLYEKLLLSVLVVIMIFTLRSASKDFKFTPNYAKAHNSLGTVLTVQKKFEQAEKEFKKALGYGAELNVYAHINLAQLYLTQGDIPKAEKELNLALRLDSSISEIHRLLGNVYVSQGKTNQAMEEYQKMGEEGFRKSGAAKKHLSIGSVYFRQGEHEKAIEAYRKSIEIQPVNPEAYSNIGVIYIEQKKLEQAEKELKKAIALDRKYEKAYRNLGVVYAMKKQFLEAIELWEKALKLSPQDSEIEDYIKRAKKEMVTPSTTMTH